MITGQIDRFAKGSPAPYHLILGMIDARDFAIVLSGSDDYEFIRDTLISRIPDSWYKFQRLAFVIAGELLSVDAVSTDKTEWWFSTSNVEGFIDETLLTLEHRMQARRMAAAEVVA